MLIQGVRTLRHTRPNLLEIGIVRAKPSTSARSVPSVPPAHGPLPNEMDRRTKDGGMSPSLSKAILTEICLGLILILIPFGGDSNSPCIFGEFV